jgi:hypothetical protein
MREQADDVLMHSGNCNSAVSPGAQHSYHVPCLEPSISFKSMSTVILYSSMLFRLQDSQKKITMTMCSEGQLQHCVFDAIQFCGSQQGLCLLPYAGHFGKYGDRAAEKTPPARTGAMAFMPIVNCTA